MSAATVDGSGMNGRSGLLWGLVIAGVAAFLWGALSADPRSTWGIYLVNLLFWSSFAITGPALAAMMQMSEARWSPSVKRLALTTAGFLPVSLVGFVILFVLVVSLWAFDLVMTLDPIWYSGLFGGYYVVKALYTGFGLVTFLTIRANARGVTNVAPSGIQDMAKLTFAMSVMWMYFFFSQYLVIWYGNVPIETRFFVARFFNPPWGVVAWLVFIFGWLIPFSYLLKRLTGRPPTRHKVLVVILFFGWISIFVEHVLVVFPSLDRAIGFPLGVKEVLITAGFFALFALSRRRFLQTYNPVLRQAK